MARIMRKNSDSDRMVILGGKVHPNTREEVRRLAQLDDRPVSAMVRRLIEIGLSVERARFESTVRDSRFISASS